METKIEKVLYTGVTHTTGGRSGKSKSDDGQLDIILSPPGLKAAGTNPEQLFAAGWSACFIGALGIAAKQFNITLPADHFVDAAVDLVLADGGYTLQARLNIGLPGVAPEVAQQLITAAQQTCPYSKAVEGNVKVEYILI